MGNKIEEGQTIHMAVERSGIPKDKLKAMLDNAKKSRDAVGAFLKSAKEASMAVGSGGSDTDLSSWWSSGLWDEWWKQYRRWESQVMLLKSAYNQYDRVVKESAEPGISMRSLIDSD